MVTYESSQQTIALDQNGSYLDGDVNTCCQCAENVK